MAKSSYLDNLINGTLPIIPRSTYINKLWRETTNSTVTHPASSIFTNLTNSSIYTLMGSNYLNDLSNMVRNQVTSGLPKNYTSVITLDNRYLPISRELKKDFDNFGDGSYRDKIIAPPGYLPASITRTTVGMKQKEIPILFPKSFSRSIQASYAKENPVGSTRPIVAYSFTNAEQIPLEFDALADYLPNGYTTLNEYVEDIISILKPGSSNSAITEPTVTVTLADISFQGICESISINYDNVYGDKTFTHAVISCNFTKLS